MPLSNRIGTARIRIGIPMTAFELAQILQSRLAKYGLSVKAVKESSHMPTTGVIMTPKGRRGVHIKDIPHKETRTPRDRQPDELKTPNGQEGVN